MAKKTIRFIVPARSMKKLKVIKDAAVPSTRRLRPNSRVNRITRVTNRYVDVAVFPDLHRLSVTSIFRRWSKAASTGSSARSPTSRLAIYAAPRR
ncbi:MAG: hypothetical protein AB7T37_06860 [Dehalococcoidia bacterium]